MGNLRSGLGIQAALVLAKLAASNGEALGDQSRAARFESTTSR